MAETLDKLTEVDQPESTNGHVHPGVPVEFDHPISVRDSDIPPGLTTQNVAVVQMGGSAFRTLPGNFYPASHYQQAFKVFKKRHGDCFDFAVFFLDPRLDSPGFGGLHRAVYNEISGINRGGFNSRASWDSDRLQSQIVMNRFSIGTLLQEVGHRWGAFARYKETRAGARKNDLTLRDGAHWALAFDDGDSPMDYDELRHIRRTTTTWLREPVRALEFRYCNLDLYLMGLISESEVGRFTLIKDYTPIGAPLPGGRQMIRGKAKNLGVRNIVWSEGKRVPNSTQSQKNFRAAFIVITRNESRLDQQFVRKVELMRQQLTQYFAIASKNRGCMDTRLCCGNTISNSGETSLVLKPNKLTWSKPIYHGLGPVPAKVELGLVTSIGGSPIDSWSREETPDISTGVQQLSAQVKRDPYDGTFRIVAQYKNPSQRKLTFKWFASAIS